MAPRALQAATVEGDPSTYENQNVHAVYEEIAAHFSSTRYKPWPIIAAFISSLQTGWVGLDAGTGNGKYLPLPLDRPSDIWTIGVDRSKNLLELARHAGASGVVREVVIGNVLDNPWRTGAFDYAISIATIHHLATHERRRFAVQVCVCHGFPEQHDNRNVKRLLESVSQDYGRILIYVWAIEQDELSKRKVVDNEDEAPASGKDVVVPWVLSKELSTKTDNDATHQKPQVYNRYYHMFAKGELPQLVQEAAEHIGLRVGVKPQQSLEAARGVEIVQDGWERSNYYVELKLWRTI